MNISKAYIIKPKLIVITVIGMKHKKTEIIKHAIL